MRPIQPSGKGRRGLLKQLGLGAAAVAALALTGAGVIHLARAESPVAPAGAPPAGANRPFTEKVPGTAVAFDMVPIPAGTFTMGSPETEKKRKADEGPQYEVKVDALYMGKCEVTWGEYNEFLRNYQVLASAKRPPIPADKMADAVTFPTPMYELEAGPKLERMGRGEKDPAVIMSHYAAKQYTKWLSKKTGRFYRLPTEAEWEYACRAGTKTAYSFGDDPKQLKDYGWFYDNATLTDGDPGYHEVGQKKPNPWGLYDMHGNVAEMVVDQYEADWYKKAAAKGNGKAVDWKDACRWPDAQYPRLVRGGSWNQEADECRSATRTKVTTAQNVTDPQLPKSPHWLSDGFWIGFRVVSPVVEPSAEEKIKWWEADNDAVRDITKRDREIRGLVTPAGTEASSTRPATAPAAGSPPAGGAGAPQPTPTGK